MKINHNYISDELNTRGGTHERKALKVRAEKFFKMESILYSRAHGVFFKNTCGGSLSIVLGLRGFVFFAFSRSPFLTETA